MAFCIHGYLASQSLVQDGLSATGELAPNRLGGQVPQKHLANNGMGRRKTSGPEQGRSATGHRADSLAAEDEHRQTVSHQTSYVSGLC